MDGRKGTKRFKVGEDFADFLVWRKDGMASYELATVVDDHLMDTEIVRGEDLPLSSARQCLLFDCLGWDRAAFTTANYYLEIMERSYLNHQDRCPVFFPLFKIDLAFA